MEALGSKASRRSILVSASLSVLCLFYLFTVGTFLQVRIYPLVDRVTYYTNFNFYIVNEFVDHVVIGSLLIFWLTVSMRSKINRILVSVFAAIFITTAATNYDPALDGIALAALPTIVLLIVYNWYSQRKILDSTRSNLTLNYLAIIGIITGLIGFAIAIYSLGFPSNEPVMRSYSHEIFWLFSSFSPILMLILITAFPVKILINFLSNMRKKGVEVTASALNWKAVSTKAKIGYLSVFMFLSIMMVIIPHLPSINKDNQLVGVDTADYANWMNDLKNSQNTQDFLNKVFIQHSNGDRPISLILIFAFQQMMSFGNDSNSSLTIEYLPLLLDPLIILAVYFLTRELVADNIVPLFAAFLTAVSFHVLIGVYAGFYANWLALIFGYFSFIFLFKFLKGHGTKNLALYGILLMLMLFSHVYTWSIFAIVTGIFLGVLMMRRNNPSDDGYNKANIYKIKKKSLILLFLVLLSTVATDIGRAFLIGSSGGIEKDLQLGSAFAGPEQFALRWNNLTYGVTVYVGGLLANFLILGLGVYWLSRCNLKETSNIFIVVFLSIGILPFLFGDWQIQTRVFYNIPFQIPAALALYYVRHANRVIRLFPICLWLVAVAIIAVSNFYLVLPSQQP